MKRIVALVVVLFSASVLLAGPVDKKQVSADAKWAVHADVEVMLASDIGKFVLDEINKQQSAAAGLKVFANTFGFDLTKDLKGITLYGADFTDKAGAAIINCKFDKDKLITLLKTNPSYKESKLGDRTVYQWQDKAKDGDKPAGPIKYGAFYSDDMAVVTQDNVVLASALDVLDGKKDNLAKGALAKTLPEPKGAFVVAAMTDLAQAAKAKPDAAIFKKMDSAVFAAGEDGGKFFARLSVTATSEQTATDLRKMADGFLAFLDMVQGMQTDDNKPGIPASLATITKDIKMSSDGATVKVDLSTDSKNVVEFLKEAQMIKAKASTSQDVK